jgi:uncharacterized protein (DUF433 family)
MAVAGAKNDPLTGGFYTVAEAARLLGIDSSQRITRWVCGDEPIIERQYKKLGPKHEIGFWDLLEVRFVEHFRRQKISLQSLRVAARNARRELKVTHPFATSGVKFQTDRKAVFLETAKETGDRFFLNLMTNQVEIYEAIEQILAKDLQFNPQGVARLWWPAKNESPNVVVSPYFAFGQPVISKKRVPTATIFRLWKAESGNDNAVAEWFGVERQVVQEAVEFELRRAA